MNLNVVECERGPELGVGRGEGEVEGEEAEDEEDEEGGARLVRMVGERVVVSAEDGRYFIPIKISENKTKWYMDQMYFDRLRLRRRARIMSPSNMYRRDGAEFKGKSPACFMAEWPATMWA